MALGIRLVDLMPKLLLIDGDNLAYRCFLARQNSPTGLLVNYELFFFLGYVEKLYFY